MTGFVSIKVAAKLIGPAGIALVGQFMNVITIISSLSTGCIGQGVTKNIAENYDEPERQLQVIKNAARITLICCSIFSIIVPFISRPLSIYIFKTTTYQSIIILFGISISLNAFNLLFISILNGFKTYKKIISINILSNLYSLVISVLLVVFFNLYGALLGCIAGQSIIILVTFYFIRHEFWFQQLFSSVRIEKKIIRELSGFTLMALASSLLVPYAQIPVRNTITNKISLDSAGLWEGMNRISAMYLMFITTSIGIFYLPRLSEIKDNFELKREILKTMKIVLPLLALVSFILYLMRDLIIHLIFSEKFVSMRELFSFQMVGDFFKMSSWLIAYLFFAKAKTKQFIFSEVTANICFVLFSYIGITQFGLKGVVYAYAITYLCYFVLCAYFFRHIFFAKRNTQ